MKRIFFGVLIVFAVAVSGFAQSDLQTAATVNLTKTEMITVRQFRAEVDRMEKTAGRALTQSERLQVLDVMINERLILQAAERDRVVVTENEVNQQMQQLRGVLAQQLGRAPTEAEFAQAVSNQYGLPVAAFREQMHRQLVSQKYLMTKKESVINSAKQPTEADIVTAFNLRRAQFVRPETVEFASIQIPYGADAAARTRARQLADQLVREIGTDPSKFDTVGDRAVLPSSGFNYHPVSSVPMLPAAQTSFGQDFINTAFSLRQGQVSKLIETNEEYLIIKVTRNLEFKNLELDDIVPYYMLPQGVDPRTTTTVRNLLGSLIMMERQQAALVQASQELVNELRTGRTFQIFERNLTW
ncbi:MAG: SurA N-terminal domain-containing protein [Treponema sp.]|jgi:parvulin-like peptidyl-prolyl isomerase|nr:SurA N-terminal domain-containing protein [Treponema sp.]